jgi:hypothetical protein
MTSSATVRRPRPCCAGRPKTPNRLHYIANDRVGRSVSSLVAWRVSQANDSIGKAANRSGDRPKCFYLGARRRQSDITGSMCWRAGRRRRRPRWRPVGSCRERPRVAARRGKFDTLEARRSSVGPTKPLLRFPVHVVRRRAVIAVMTVVQDATVHPRQIAPVHRRQRLPQFAVKQHAAIATAVHPVAPRHRVDVNRLNPRIPLRRTSRAMCVILTLAAA